MIDAPEKIWIEQDDCPYFYEESELTEVGSPVTEYIRADLYAALEAQLAEAKRFIEMALDYEGDVFGRHHNDVVDLLLPAAPATSKGGANHD